MNLQYLIKYKTFSSVEDMDATVQEHINVHQDQLTESTKAVLYCLASHSLTAVGACHLKTETIANEIGVSTQTVYRATKKLAELGIITKHKTVKKTGQGASIYVIAPKINTRNVSHSMRETCQSLETHVKPVIPTDSHVKTETVSKNLSTSSFNPFVNVVNNVNAHVNEDYLKSSLREILDPMISSKEDFDEFCKIAFGRIKQYMQQFEIPYLQLESIILKSARDLIRKKDVRKKFGMYSRMIERQTLQLFEKFIQPVQQVKQSNKELVPDWFEKRNEPSTVVNNDVDYEAERAKVLAKLG